MVYIYTFHTRWGESSHLDLQVAMVVVAFFFVIQCIGVVFLYGLLAFGGWDCSGVEDLVVLFSMAVVFRLGNSYDFLRTDLCGQKEEYCDDVVFHTGWAC